jgi:flagellar biogenesis protein FliO
MGFFEQMFGEFGLPARAIVALILVLALIALTVWLMRRFGDARGMTAASGRGRQQRLAVLDSASVDARRRLVLIRRDNVEHLILIGGPTDVVIEPGIVRAQPVGGTRAAPRGYEAEEFDAPIVPETTVEPERPAPPPMPAPTPRAPSPEIPRQAALPPRPAPRAEQQYADMAQRLDAALRKPQGDTPVTPPAPAPRTPEPRMFEQRPLPPPPRPASPRPVEARPEPRVAETRPQPAQSEPAADVFSSLEEEMASLLRPAPKKEPEK